MIMNIFSEPEVPQITVDDLKKFIDQKKQFTLLDVRTPGEYARGKIAGSINIPVDLVVREVVTVIADKQSLIYVYCLSGSREVQLP
jgi:phage shock protein E